MAFDFTYPTPLPSTKGWGPGWPNCQTNHTQHPIFQGGVNNDILELANLLVKEIESRGYRFRDGWSWGFGCRATKGGSGDTPSFHSWGLALDFNAPENVFGGAASSSDINVNNHWIVGLMAEYGFFWLGPSIGDWMHFSFCGSPADAKAMTIKARERLGNGDEMAYADFKEGITAFLHGDPEPTDEGDKRFGYRFAKISSESPKPGDHSHPGLANKAHDHKVVGRTE